MSEKEQDFKQIIILISIISLMIYGGCIILVWFGYIEGLNSPIDSRCNDLGYGTREDGYKNLRDYKVGKRLSGNPFLLNAEFEVLKIECQHTPEEYKQNWTWEK